MIVAITPRLELRRFSLDDVEGFYNLNEDSEVIRYTGDRPFKDRQEVETFILAYDHYEKHGIGRWSVYLRETGNYIGFSGLKFDPAKNQLDIGFRFYREHWSKGYATESAIAALRIGFDEFGADVIVGRAMQDNAASHSVLKKLAMRPDFVFEESGKPWLQYQLTATRFHQHFDQ
ncbi:MAG: GNAT family N-acetyltransferase [Shewanella sp.]|nr:GNAT family N-acetyltransferase [Shewanella sp.]